MVPKVAILALFIACTQAIRFDNHDATSSIVFNNNQNSVHHIQSAYAAPAHGYAAPVTSYSSHAIPVAQYAAPVVKVNKNAGLTHDASSYSSFSFGNDGHQFTAPAAKINVQPIHQYSYAAPAKIAVAPVAIAHAAPVAVAHAAPAYNYGGHAEYQHEEYAHPKYEFSYGVEDHQSGDFHSHKETRDGDVTHGEYSLQEADGTIRTVKYSVDKHSGFNAVVERTGQAQYPQPTKAVVAAPIIKAKVAAPYYHH